jgi:hypothetical protein
MLFAISHIVLLVVEGVSVFWLWVSLLFPINDIILVLVEAVSVFWLWVSLLFPINDIMIHPPPCGIRFVFLVVGKFAISHK